MDASGSPRFSTVSSESEDATSITTTTAITHDTSKSSRKSFSSAGPSSLISKKSAASSPVTDLKPEDDEGSVEYKWRLIEPTPERFVELVTQLNFRLAEGQNSCLYQLGVLDNGKKKGLSPDQLSASIQTLERMATELGAEATVLSESAGREGNTASVLVRRVPKALEEYLDVRIAVAGNVDSGKSTLVGVLTGSGNLDNGRGLARSQIFTHKHEIETGRTSAVSQAILGFSSRGSVVNYTNTRSLTWADVVERSTKVVTFYDLAGHERYLKTVRLSWFSCLNFYLTFSICF